MREIKGVPDCAGSKTRQVGNRQEDERWYRAEDYPEEYENYPAWEFCERRNYVTETFVPKGYSRDPHHCGGLWFMRIRRPAPPTLDNPEAKP